MKKKMNKTLRKFSKNAKALSPVVASIILIAVTVAVSIAVAAWMGGMTIGFMNTEQIKITNVALADGPPQTATITLQNTGSNPVTISDIYFANEKITAIPVWTNATGSTITSKISGNTAALATFDQAYTDGGSYQIKVVTSQGNSFTFQANAPST